MSLLLVLLLSSPVTSFAQNFKEDSSSETDTNFDPFTDYSDFEEDSDEEADINFFRNGRFFSVGLVTGLEGFTDVLGQLHKPALTYGIFVSYFFDLRFGLQVTYSTGDYSLRVKDTNGAVVGEGKTNLQHLAVDIKYFLNTQNVTKGLGNINPFIVGGVTNYTRTRTLTGSQGFVRDTTFGFQAGAGVEFPINRNKMFFGVQGTYNYVSFVDESSPIIVNGAPQGVTPRGDIYMLLGQFGVNF